MCGIVGYIGRRSAQPILIECLKRLEYRGYDSWGIGILGTEIQVIKDKGMISNLGELPKVEGGIGIGHTRWATHGRPSKENAHPHTDCKSEIAVVHNGVITNFQTLREKLSAEGHVFRSETDTEVIAHLIEKYYQGNLKEALEKAIGELKGSYALAIIHKDFEGIAVACCQSPLVIGLGDREFFLASDTPAFLDYTNREIRLRDGDIGIISKEGLKIFNQGVEVKREEEKFIWGIEEARKGGYEHFMLKEIHDQPKALSSMIGEYLFPIESEVNLGFRGKRDFNNILFLGCGTSYYAALIGKQVTERLARMPARAEIASEFNYSDPVLEKTWAIAITQSGETFDTKEALKRAKEHGAYTLAIVNRVGSTISYIADETFYTRAGLELCVAATKSFTCQLLALYLLALFLSQDEMEKRRLIAGLHELPGKVSLVLEKEEELAELGAFLADYDELFLVSRGINLPIASEGALKFKEIAYIHAEDYPAGELKHGPFALLTPHTPVIAIIGKDETYEALLSNIKEMKAREAPVVALSYEGDNESDKYVDSLIKLPEINPLLSPVVNVVALQLLAYYAAKKRGCPIDKPRNLAKSVTVE